MRVKREKGVVKNMSRKLLIVIDVQKDFVEGGALPYGYPLESNTQKVVEFALAWAKDEAHQDERLMFCTQDTHDSNYFNTLEGKNLPVEHCKKNTVGWQFVDATDEDYGLGWWCNKVFLKPTFGTFKIKEAIEQFERAYCEEINEIFLIGYDLSVCILSNAVILRAAFPNKKIAVLTDLCGCINKQTFDAACEVLKCQQIDLIESTQVR